MTILNAHLDGNRVLLVDPIPEGAPANAKLCVIIEHPGPSKALAAIAKMAIDAPELPADYSVNHCKHLYGRGLDFARCTPATPPPSGRLHGPLPSRS